MLTFLKTLGGKTPVSPLQETLGAKTEQKRLAQKAALAAQSMLSEDQESWLTAYAQKKSSRDGARELAHTLLACQALHRPEVFDVARETAEAPGGADWVRLAFRRIGQHEAAGVLEPSTVDEAVALMRSGSLASAAAEASREERLQPLLASLGLTGLKGPFDPEGLEDVLASLEELEGCVAHLHPGFPKKDPSVQAGMAREWGDAPLDHEGLKHTLAQAVEARLTGRFLDFKYGPEAQVLSLLSPEQLAAWRRDDVHEVQGLDVPSVQEVQNFFELIAGRCRDGDALTDTQALRKEQDALVESLRLEPPVSGTDPRALRMAALRTELGMRDVLEALPRLSAERLPEFASFAQSRVRGFREATVTKEELAAFELLLARAAAPALRVSDTSSFKGILSAFDERSCLSPVGEQAGRRWGAIAALVEPIKPLRAEMNGRLDVRTLMRLVELELPHTRSQEGYTGPALWVDAPKTDIAGVGGEAKVIELHRQALAKGRALGIPVVMAPADVPGGSTRPLELAAKAEGIPLLDIPHRMMRLSVFAGRTARQYSDNLFQGFNNGGRGIAELPARLGADGRYRFQAPQMTVVARPDLEGG